MAALTLLEFGVSRLPCSLKGRLKEGGERGKERCVEAKGVLQGPDRLEASVCATMPAATAPDPHRSGTYVVQGEMTMVVSSMRRNARWSGVEDEGQDPLLQGFAVLKQTLASVNGTCCPLSVYRPVLYHAVCMRIGSAPPVLSTHTQRKCAVVMYLGCVGT